MLPFSEKVQIMDVIEREMYAEFTKTYGKTKSIHETKEGKRRFC